MIRQLNSKDYNEIFSLFNQLTDAPIINKELYTSIINNLSDKHTILVYELNNKIVGTITLIIEQKLIHGGKCVAHIEDLVVDSNNKNQKIATILLKYCIEEAKKYNCYKVILDCNEDLIEFYKKNNFNYQGVCMRFNC